MKTIILSSIIGVLAAVALSQAERRVEAESIIGAHQALFGELRIHFAKRRVMCARIGRSR